MALDIKTGACQKQECKGDLQRSKSSGINDLVVISHPIIRWLGHVIRREEGCEERSEKNGGWKEKEGKEGKTEKEMGGLYQGGYEGSGSDGGGGTGSSKMDEEDPHRRPQLNWESPQKKKKKIISNNYYIFQ